MFGASKILYTTEKRRGDVVHFLFHNTAHMRVLRKLSNVLMND